METEIGKEKQEGTRMPEPDGGVKPDTAETEIPADQAGGPEEEASSQEKAEEAQETAQETPQEETTARDAEEAPEEEAAAGEEETADEEPAQDPDQEPRESSGEEPESTPVKEKKGFFGRNKKKDKKDVQIEELKDRLLRHMAEFDNYRKRTDKEKAAMFEVGARSVIEKILPVVDNFERGLASAGENSEDPYVQGMEKIYRQLMTVLEGMEVQPIEAEGKEFDPNLHNAVMHVDDESVGENMVVQELQKGYTYRGTVIRHSMVKVAN